MDSNFYTRDELRCLLTADPSLTASELAEKLCVSRQRIYFLCDQEGLVPGDPNKKRAAAKKKTARSR